MDLTFTVKDNLKPSVIIILICLVVSFLRRRLWII